MMEWISLILEALKFLGPILAEIFAERKRTRERQEKFELTEAKFREIVDRVLQKMKDDARHESEQARRIEDEVDEATRPRGPHVS
jgi:broad-specificity NMP kinase